MANVKKNISVLSVRSWCHKCMTTTYMCQIEPGSNPLLMKCEICNAVQDAYDTALRRACLEENIKILEIKERKQK